jgi:hypothetical protein
MVETITPAVCGSRHRHRIAVALFTAGALAASAVLGGLLGLVGGLLDRPWALGAAALLAVLAAAREAGWIRIPVPGAHRQVPERWRREWPLPAWSLGYGLGLGAGVFTYQPASTFWVAAAGSLALGNPATSAACMAAFGVGRAAMVILPARGGRDPEEAVEGMARHARGMRRANAAALALVAVLLAAAPAVAQAPAGPLGRHDPAVWGNVLAVAQSDAAGVSSVTVTAPGQAPVTVPGAGAPSLDADLLAYADDAGVRVIRWTTGEEVARVPGVGRPALDWPLLAVVRRPPGHGATLELVNLASGRRRIIDRAGPGVDLGRPALRGGIVAWHKAAARRSVVLLRPVRRGGRVRVVASSATAVEVNPSLAAGHVAWVESRAEVSALRIRKVRGVRVRTLATLAGPDRILWTTALSPRRAYATRLNLRTGQSRLIARFWRPARR